MGRKTACHFIKLRRKKTQLCNSATRHTHQQHSAPGNLSTIFIATEKLVALVIAHQSNLTKHYIFWFTLILVSSFLKQHNDEATVFQSLRDINELIQYTIELKRRQMAVEKWAKRDAGQVLRAKRAVRRGGGYKTEARNESEEPNTMEIIGNQWEN